MRCQEVGKLKGMLMAMAMIQLMAIAMMTIIIRILWPMITIIKLVMIMLPNRPNTRAPYENKCAELQTAAAA